MTQLDKIYKTLENCSNKLVTVIISNFDKEFIEGLFTFCFEKQAIICFINENNDKMYYKEMLEHSHYVIIVDELKNKLDTKDFTSTVSKERKIVIDLHNNLSIQAKKITSYTQPF